MGYRKLSAARLRPAVAASLDEIVRPAKPVHKNLLAIRDYLPLVIQLFSGLRGEGPISRARDTGLI